MAIISKDMLLDEVLDRFERQWQAGAAPRLEDFLGVDTGLESTGGSLGRRELLSELVKIDLEYRWRRLTQEATAESDVLLASDPERPLLLAEYIERFPELGPLDRAAPDLLAEEYRVRLRWGDRPTRAVFLRQFPNRRTALEPLLARIEAELPPSASATLALATAIVSPPSSLNRSPGAETFRSVLSDESIAADKTIGRYRVVRLLGEGSYGSVYLCHDDDLDRPVAIKVLRAPGCDASSFAPLLREARLAAQVRHEALISVYDIGHAPSGEPFLVMQYVEGKSLQEVLLESAPTVEQVVRWMSAIAEGVHAAHKVGLIHCDLKPANVLVDADGAPYVADFGLAICRSETQAEPWQRRGTPLYMAPEQVRGDASRFDGRTDVWALGIMLYEMLTRQRPFRSASRRELFDDILGVDPAPPRQFAAGVPVRLEEICLKCLRKEVANRFTTAKELARALADSLVDSLSAGIASQALSSAPVRAAHVSMASPHGGNLPVPETQLFGREADIAMLAEQVAGQRQRVITLLGPGGIGKTRLALAVAEGVAEQFEGGCWFVDLSSAHTAAEVAAAVARALAIPIGNGASAEDAVAHALEFRPPLLLVLDNFEQAVETAGATVGLWRRVASHVRFLVTSRFPLELSWEYRYEVRPLALPAGSSAALADCPSYAMLLDRARQANASFVANDEHALALEAICCRLEGIPLALELAAARLSVLQPKQLAERLDDMLELLRSSCRDLAPRQRTLEATIQWSFDLLSAAEQQGFLQACIFSDSFDMPAAEAVICLPVDADGSQVLDIIQDLHAKGFLRTTDGGGTLRYQMYRTIREFGLRRWKAAALAEALASLERRFAAYYLRLGKSLVAEGPDAARRLLEPETANLLAVHGSAVLAGSWREAADAALLLAPLLALHRPCEQRIKLLDKSLAILPETSIETADEVQRVELLLAAASAHLQAGGLDRAQELADRAAERARTLDQPALGVEAVFRQAQVLRTRGDFEQSAALYAQCQAEYEAQGDVAGQARAGADRGFCVWQAGQWQLALELFGQAEQQAVRCDDRATLGVVLRHRGHLLRQRGDYFEATRCYAEAEALARAIQDEHAVALSLGHRGTVLSDQGDFSAAAECYDKALAICHRVGHKRGVAIHLANRGLLAADAGDTQKALGLLEQAEALNRQVGSRFGIALNRAGRANALAELGQDAAARTAYEEAEGYFQQLGNKFLQALVLCDRASLLTRRHDQPGAKRELEQAAALLVEAGAERGIEYFRCLAGLAEVEFALGNVHEAQRLAKHAAQIGFELGLSSSHPNVRLRGQLQFVTRLASEAPAG